jgi:hypothetical protein
MLYELVEIQRCVLVCWNVYKIKSDSMSDKLMID